jgi:hypothetical protein
MLIVCFSGTLQAQDWYIGAGIGNTFIATEFQDAEDQLQKLDENSTGYKFFAGVTTPFPIGIEGGYRNLGTVTLSQFEFESKTTGWDVYAMGRFEILMIVDVFAKAGMFFWKTEDKFVENIISESGSDFAWGIGAGVHLGPVGVRLEWENFQVADPVSLSMLSLSATYGF